MHALLESPGQSEGFTLLEVLVALAIFSVAIVTASSSFQTYLKSNYSAEVRFEAAHAAQSIIDELRFEDVEALPSNGSDAARIVTMNDGRDYEVTVSYCTDSTYCSSSEIRHLAVEVEYREKVVYRTEAVFTALEKGYGSTSEDTDDDTGSGGGGEDSGSDGKKKCKTFKCRK